MTERDQFVRSELQAMLRPGETITNAAHVMRAPSFIMQIVYAMICIWYMLFQIKHRYAALTAQRIIMIDVGFYLFSPALVNKGVDEIDLTQVASVSFGGLLNNRSIDFKKKDGTEESIRIAPWGRNFSGQKTFMDDVASAVRALGGSAA